MVIVMAMMICEVADVLFGKFMVGLVRLVGFVVKEECVETEPERRAVVLM